MLATFIESSAVSRAINERKLSPNELLVLRCFKAIRDWVRWRKLNLCSVIRIIRFFVICWHAFRGLELRLMLELCFECVLLVIGFSRVGLFNHAGF